MSLSKGTKGKDSQGRGTVQTVSLRTVTFGSQQILDRRPTSLPVPPLLGIWSEYAIKGVDSGFFKLEVVVLKF